jgi:uncharacterized membrane protein
MFERILKWIRTHYAKTVSSIAFYPAIIAIIFLILSWLMLKLDFSELGKSFKKQLNWLSLKDASTARSILTAIAGGVISLTVFSFSMVMIVLNQAASQMSNRILNSMIENRFQQIVLGFYIGTIVYALFLLSTIRDITSGIYVPAISIYFLIGLTITDIFLFIYFLDYVTQTVKYETVIKRVKDQTMLAMKKHYSPIESLNLHFPETSYKDVKAVESGYFQGIQQNSILELASKYNVRFEFLHPVGTYLIAGSNLVRAYGTKDIPDEGLDELMLSIDFYDGQPIDRNPEYGFRQLAEVAIRALSPGVNDPATAVLSINALSALFAYRLKNCQSSVIETSDHKTGILLTVQNFKDLFKDCIYPIWDYGNKDRYIQQALTHMLKQLNELDEHKDQESLFEKLLLKNNFFYLKARLSSACRFRAGSSTLVVWTMTAYAILHRLQFV